MSAVSTQCHLEEPEVLRMRPRMFFVCTRGPGLLENNVKHSIAENVAVASRDSKSAEVGRKRQELELSAIERHG